jgi:hypothetical protein
LAPFNETIKIDLNGKVTINRSTGLTGGTTYLGVLNATESQALNTAFVNANPASLPATIPIPAATNLTGIPSETLTSTIGSAEWTSVAVLTPFNGMTTLTDPGNAVRFFRPVVDAIRGPAERIVRGAIGHPHHGFVRDTNGALQVGKSPIDPTDPFYGLIAGAVGNKVVFDGIGKGRVAHVLDVLGTVTSDQPLLTFPSPGADVIVTIPVNTPLDVTNLTLSGNYFEVESNGQRGFVQASAVSIIR